MIELYKDLISIINHYKKVLIKTQYKYTKLKELMDKKINIYFENNDIKYIIDIKKLHCVACKIEIQIKEGNKLYGFCFKYDYICEKCKKYRSHSKEHFITIGKNTHFITRINCRDEIDKFIIDCNIKDFNNSNFKLFDKIDVKINLDNYPGTFFSIYINDIYLWINCDIEKYNLEDVWINLGTGVIGAYLWDWTEHYGVTQIWSNIKELDKEYIYWKKNLVDNKYNNEEYDYTFQSFIIYSAIKAS